MLNIGGGELLLILLVALVVLGPDKLPDAARQAGRLMQEFRKISNGFQRELRSAMKDPVGSAMQERGYPDVTPIAAVPPIDDESDVPAPTQPVAGGEEDGEVVPEPGEEPPADPDAGIPSDR